METKKTGLKTFLWGLLVAAGLILCFLFVQNWYYARSPPSTMFRYAVKISLKGDMGSGVVIGHVHYDNGAEHSLIVTCYHVVTTNTSVTVFYGYKKFDGTVRYSDQKSDLALIEVKAVLPVAPLYVGKLKAGTRDYAVGYPLNEGLTISSGFVGGPDKHGIVTTSAIWPGNSGGGLYVYQNGKPALVGIVEAIRAFPLGFSFQMADTVGFAIPLAKVLSFLNKNL